MMIINYSSLRWEPSNYRFPDLKRYSKEILVGLGPIPSAAGTSFLREALTLEIKESKLQWSR
jgi:hypothetical protein